MAIELSSDDFDRFANIMGRDGEWALAGRRVDLMQDVLAGSPRKNDLLAQLDLDGTPRGVAVRTIQKLVVFGQDEPGREALGVLINKLIANRGGGDDADFLRGLLNRYAFVTQPVAARGLSEWHGTKSGQDVAEKIIGENTLRDIYVLEVLLELARSVVRIRGRRQTGTGFLVASDLLLTNHHVIDCQSTAEDCLFQFNYQLSRTGKALPTQTARIAPGGLFYSSPMAPFNATPEELDFTIVQLADVPEGLPHLTLKPSSVERDSRVTIIQHPGGNYKKISMQNNFVEYADELVLQYTTSTEPGSSGSPVLNDAFDVVAVHHSGGELSEPSTKRRYLRNEGIRASAILDDLRRNETAIYKRLAL